MVVVSIVMTIVTSLDIVVANCLIIIITLASFAPDRPTPTKAPVPVMASIAHA